MSGIARSFQPVQNRFEQQGQTDNQSQRPGIAGGTNAGVQTFHRKSDAGQQHSGQQGQDTYKGSGAPTDTDWLPVGGYNFAAWDGNYQQQNRRRGKNDLGRNTYQRQFGPDAGKRRLAVPNGDMAEPEERMTINHNVLMAQANSGRPIDVNHYNARSAMGLGNAPVQMIRV